MLFHISEEPGIERFEPRVSGQDDVPVVWAIDERRVHNYLLPRDCPRVTFYAGPRTTPGDVERFLGASPAVVAIESAWLDRVRSCRFFRYQLPPGSFECTDEGAGYFVNRTAVVPERVEEVDDPIAELLARRVELRVMQNVWSLHDAVVASPCFNIPNTCPH